MSYTYDELYQLVEEQDLARNIYTYYTYDDAGNLLLKSSEDEDLKYGPHYHTMMIEWDGNHHGTHYHPGDSVPEPWNSIYFGD